ncbi:MAG: RNA-directed DNA polymerase [Halobacteriota archaeon]
MSLKDSLIRRGYMPENLPPAFATDKIADYFLSNPTDKFIRESRQTFRSCIYNASKRGLTRRGFSVIHPVAAHDLAQFIEMHQQKFDTYFSTSKDSLSSLSIPRPTPEGDRALAISSHGEVETVRLSKLSQYRFIAKTDISRFYHSIYTHSIPWAYHGKEDAKADRNNLIFNKLDEIIRYSQDGQTIGIPVGPDASRMIAEIISIAIDKEYLKRNKNTHCEVVRHVDDIWLGANSHADVEKSLCRYREAIRTFELDINENKTRVYSGNFCFFRYLPS